MKTLFILVVVAALHGAVAEEPVKVTKEQKATLRNLLKDIKAKGNKTRKSAREVSVPVASAGARGSEIRSAGRFAILWPEDAHVSPLTALSVNIEHSAVSNKGLPDMQAAGQPQPSSRSAGKGVPGIGPRHPQHRRRPENAIDGTEG